MISAFYCSVTPKSFTTQVSGSRGGSSQYEKKLDQILDSIRDQNNKMTVLEQKGKQTLESMEGLDKQLASLENKVNNMEQLVSQENSQPAVKRRTCVPPELSVKLFVVIMH